MDFKVNRMKRLINIRGINKKGLQTPDPACSSAFILKFGSVMRPLVPSVPPFVPKPLVVPLSFFVKPWRWTCKTEEG